jgi:hypothetical protein
MLLCLVNGTIDITSWRNTLNPTLFAGASFGAGVEENLAVLQSMFPSFVDRAPGPCRSGSYSCQLTFLVGTTRLGRIRILLELGCRRCSVFRFGGRILRRGVVLGYSHCVLVFGH